MSVLAPWFSTCKIPVACAPRVIPCPVALTVCDWVCCDVSVRSVGVGVAVGEGEGVGEGAGDGVGVGVGIGDGVGVGVGVGEGVVPGCTIAVTCACAVAEPPRSTVCA